MRSRNSLTNSSAGGWKGNEHASTGERALAIPDNQCPRAVGRQLNYHTWNSRLPGDGFFCWGGRKEQSHFEAFLVHTWMRLKSSEGRLLQQRDERFPPRGTRHRQAWVVRPLVSKPLWMGQWGTFYFLFSSCCTPWETTGTRKVRCLKRSSSQPHAPTTCTRKLSRTELLKQCGDGRREVSLCIRSTCQPLSKKFLLYKHGPNHSDQ